MDMTWGEFKRLIEAAGVTDETAINYIDVSPRSDDGLTISNTGNGIEVLDGNGAADLPKDQSPK